MLSKDIRKLIIEPTLKVTGLWSESAEVLIYGTGMVESRYMNIKQIGGKALSMWQIEPNTFLDICTWLRYPKNRVLREHILSACYYVSMPVDAAVLSHNIKFAMLICRAHYLRVPNPLPRPDDALGLARYHKEYYNCGGKADVSKNEKIFQQIIDGEL